MAAVTVVTSLLLAGGGYAWADAADLVPGPLTARAPLPPPPPPAPEPQVSAPPVPAAPGGAAATAGTAEAAPVDAAALSAALVPLLADPALGPAPTLSVRDLLTGEEVVTRASGTPLEPASTTKLVTSAAALQVLGADRTLPTRVAWQPGDQRPSGRPAVVLVGGGDLLLAAGEGSPGATDGRVGLLDLAREAVAAMTGAAAGTPLLAPGTPAVDVVVDDSLLGSGPPPQRDPVDAVYVSPPSSLAVAAGRRGPGQGRDPAPAATAAAAFASALTAALGEGLGAGAPAVGASSVSPAPVPVGPVLAEAGSAPVADVLAHLLVTSDNTVADGVAGLVAHELAAPTASASAGATVVDVVRQQGVDLGPTVAADGSGLEDGSVSSAAALSGLLAAAAAAPAEDDLSLLPSLLPVAGLEGTLSSRFTAQERSAAGRGVVRAKTGTLTGVVALAGVGTTADGRGVSFALLSGGVPPGGTDAARAAADRVAAAVVACC
ncbi:D-alanyl-D-alanine carboxypeptidase [Aquipuribacter hungaricus]|uniref:D-alanyl-D-alanine carboxypeptidase n=1 Tax=Aquipuribacter hungaricus TaxID=545624 RepID=UPI00361224AE